MKLKKISLTDFRSIRHVSVNLDSDLTVIIGRNGSGKTSILDAISQLLIPVAAALQGKVRQGKVFKSDVRVGAVDSHILLEFSLDSPLFPTISELRYSEMKLQKRNKSIRDLFDKRFRANFLSVEPELIAYYRQDRGFANGGQSKDVFDASELRSTSLDGRFSPIKDLEKWWDERDAQEARTVREKGWDFRDPQLEAIRKIVMEIDPFHDISFSSTASPRGLYLGKSNGEKVHVSQLSSGELSFLILLADLARRLQVISPEKPLQNIPGVILIDEIELNLHPTWQSRVIPTLQKIFKSCRFVVSTHSPQVLSTVRNKHVRILNTDNEKTSVEIPMHTRGRRSDYLLEGVFGSPERHIPINDLISHFNRAIDDGNAQEAKRLLTEIRREIDGDPVELIAFKRRLESLGISG